MASQFEQPLDPEWLDIMRQRRMAEMLAQQGQEPIQAHGYGGVASTISPFQALGKIAQAGTSGWMNSKADEKQRMYADKLKSDEKNDMSAFMEAFRGKEQQTKPYEADNAFGEDLGRMETITQQAVAPDREKAMGVAMGSRSPMLQGAGQLLLADMLKGGDNPYAKVDPKDYTPESIARFNQTRNYGDLVPAAGVAKPQLVTVWENGKPVQKWVTPGQANGVMVGEGKPENQSDIARLMAEMNQLPPGDPRRRTYQDAIRKATTHQPPVQIANYGQPQPVVNPKTGQPELVQFPNKPGALPQFTGLKPAPDAKPPTEAEAKAAFYAQNMQQASAVLNALEAEGFDPTDAGSQIGTKMAGGVTNPLASKQAQQARQAQNQWAEQMLRMQTGAAATQDEINRTVATYFPSVGDSPEAVEQKRAMRKQAEEGVFAASGRASDRVKKPELNVGNPQEGQRSKSKSGKPIIYRNGRWEYE